ncbi:MAG: OmpA family protein [Fidelibacterota bacterium]|jgi:outer membrane protein OmpA-like peptidoglycan-associated protein|tara:strand:- start:43 stop:1092 length:1050 start_codon:yes stop_codon:yes gene_type:complete
MHILKHFILIMGIMLPSANLLAQYDELDLCRTSVYMLDNGNMSSGVSKLLVETLENVLEDEVNNLKVKDRFYKTGCNTEDCAGKDLDRTKLEFAFILNSDLTVTPGVVEIVLTNILYDFNDDKITAQAEMDLLYLRGLLEKYPYITIELGSHTDARGKVDYNINLSQRRANSAKNWLVTRGGIQASRINAVGYGMNKPKIVSSRLASRYSFIPRGGTELTQQFIDNLSTSAQKEIAHQLNRRSEVTVFSTKTEPIYGGALDLMLMDINNKLVLSDHTYSFVGLENELEDQIGLLVNDVISEWNYKECGGGFGFWLFPVILAGGYVAYENLKTGETLIGAPPALPLDCCD